MMAVVVRSPRGMSQHAKRLAALLDGESDHRIRFVDLCAILVRLGFAERNSGGSHRIFFRRGIPEIINLQPRADGTAKPYQARQVRAIIFRYHLADRADSEASDE